MATEVNTNVAQEMNITHRRNDSFELKVSITDFVTNSSFDLSQNQYGFEANTYGIMPIYQGKMTVRKRNSQHEALNIYTYFWKDNHINNIVPTLIQTGHYSGEETGGSLQFGAGNQSGLYAGIYMLGSTGSSVDEVIHIKAPHNYITFDPGEYVYDFQVRRKDVNSPNDVGSVYSTWIYGKFTITEDITQV